MGIHCAIVPFSLVLQSETMRQLITIWPLSTFTKFPILSVEEERRTDGEMVCVKREHESEIGCRVIFPHCRPIFHPVAQNLLFHTASRLVQNKRVLGPILFTYAKQTQRVSFTVSWPKKPHHITIKHRDYKTYNTDL